MKVSKVALTISLARVAFAAGNMFIAAATEVSSSSLCLASFNLESVNSAGKDPCSFGAADTIRFIKDSATSSPSLQYLHCATAGSNVGHGTPTERGSNTSQFSRPETSL
ncbi:hypothetical protein PC116_g28613 [Phytophthora cactorum]|nr:hypothetical protein PC116_g28613 [Phytophthora cactorum]